MGVSGVCAKAILRVELSGFGVVEFELEGNANLWLKCAMYEDIVCFRCIFKHVAV